MKKFRKKLQLLAVILVLPLLASLVPGMTVQAAEGNKTYTAVNSKSRAAADGTQTQAADKDGVDDYYFYVIDEAGKAEIAYCINWGQKSPKKESDGGTKGYTREKAADKNGKLMAILANGYPQNASDLQNKFDVSAPMARIATQWAIWHVTDQTDLTVADHFLPWVGFEDEDSRTNAILKNWDHTDGLNLTDPEKAKIDEAKKAIDYYKALLDASVDREYVEDHDMYIFSLPKKRFQKGERYQNLINANLIVKNKQDVVFSKTAVNGSKELPGAKLKVVKGESSEGEEVESWTSTSETHKIKLGQGTYTMVEITAPLGYEKAESITFRVNEDLSVEIRQKDNSWKPVDKNTVHMQDKEEETEVLFSKTEINKSEELPGASLKVVKGESADSKDVVDSWTSTNDSHKIKLTKGTYTMVETTAPKGYEKAESITFRVTEDLKIQIKEGENWTDVENSTVHMQDKLTPTPNQPDKPDKPDQPDKPDKPDQPDKPNTPDQPGKPNTPDQPEDNHHHNDQPNQPTKPNQPTTPSQTTSNTPGQPAGQAPTVLGAVRDNTAPAAQTTKAPQVLGARRSPETADSAPLALLFGLLGIAVVGGSASAIIWKRMHI